jgi:putative DNA primase/helicase
MKNYSTQNEINQQKLQSAALEYNDAGFAILPVKTNKRPDIETWTRYQETKPSRSEIRGWFNGSKPNTTGVAIISGKVSGNIKVIDIDVKYDLTGSLMEDFCSLVKEHLSELFPKLVIAKTVNKGFHILIRVPTEAIEGNQKLASRPATSDEAKSGDKVKVLIETRGEGGYFVAAPTVGYEWAQGTFKDVPLVTASERETLFTIARSFDQTPVKNAPGEKTASSKATSDGQSPFDDYNSRADVPALLEKHGWTPVYQRGESLHYKRPGPTDSETSANFHTGLRIFYVFSTSSEFEAGRGFNPVQVYTQLAHGGDYSAASRALYAAGYGSRHNEKTSTQQPTEINFTGEPRPLDLTLKPVEPLGDDCLPKVIVDWLRPASKVIGCPFDFLVLSAVIMVGSIIGSRLRVKPLQNSDWFVAPNLYGGLVGLPSTKKTPALDETRKTVLELQCAAREGFETAKKDYEIDAKYYEKDSVKALKESESREDYRRKVNELDETKPIQPTLKRFETNDITASKLIQFLAENPNGLMLFRDELTGWLKSLEAEYDKSARAFFLELWKGAISYEMARVDGREIQLTSGTLSIIGGVQPSKLQRFVSEAYSFDNSDGFLQRFIFAYPDIPKRAEKPTKSDYEQNQSGYAAANKLVKKLSDYDFHGKVIGANGDQFHIVKFDSEAQITVDQWKDEIENEAEKLQIEDEAFSSFLYKLPKNCFAIALIFHTLENIGRAFFHDEISDETTLKAITYIEVLKSHARRVFALGENQIFALAQMLLGKIKKGNLEQGFKARDIARKQWSGLKTPDTIKDVLSLLVDYGYLRAVETHGDGRPTVRYYIHPSFKSEVIENDEN